MADEIRPQDNKSINTDTKEYFVVGYGIKQAKV
jgi:hypothetical protein